MKVRSDRMRWLALTLVAIFTAPLAAAQDLAAGEWRQVEEHWYTLEFAGQPAGYAQTVVTTNGARFRTDSTYEMALGRGRANVKIRIDNRFEETADGDPVSIRTVQELSGTPVESTWEFDGDSVTYTTKQGDRVTTKERTAPEGEWLMPVAISRYFDARRTAGAKEITYKTFDPQSGLKLIDVTHTFVGTNEYEANGRTIPVTEWITRTTMMPVDATEYYSSDGVLVYQKVDIGMGVMVQRITTRAQALDAPGDNAPELLIATLVKPDKPIERASKATSARLRIRTKEGELPDLPTAGAQSVEMEEGGSSAVLSIDMLNPQPASGVDADNAEYTESSTMVDIEDEMIHGLLEKATMRSGDDKAGRAEDMRRFVLRWINKKGLATAFATASETARDRRGDCSEHAVLLCALLRADGIPARVASGLVYVDGVFEGQRNVFGWHMWTQALLDGHWVDLDATLREPYNAGHILTGTSSLAEGASNAEFAAVLTMMGNLEIEVLEVGYEKATEREPVKQD